jgi:7-cyano-7-deazaguanine synthase in queuosine biosynthesis
MSGGLDSVAGWYFLDKPKCVFFDTKVPSSYKERVAILSLEIPSIIDTTFDFSGIKGVYIPHRNLLFASAASKYGNEVVICGLEDDMVIDKTQEAFLAASTCLSTLSTKEVVVTSPFWDKTKAEVVQWMLDNVPDAENVIRTSVSCYSGHYGECGWCEACFRKACAMYSCGLVMPFGNKEMVKEYFRKAYDGVYIPSRCESIKKFANYLRVGM